MIPLYDNIKLLLSDNGHMQNFNHSRNKGLYNQQKSTSKINSKNNIGLLDITQSHLNRGSTILFMSKQPSRENVKGSKPSRKTSVTLNRTNLQQLQSKINTSVLTQQFTSKIILIKKLQKLEKQSIRLFYDNQIAQCFNQIKQCMMLLGEYELQQPGSEHEDFFIQHVIYLRYLQIQFHFKLGEYKKARKEYNSITGVLGLVRKTNDKMNNYLMNLKALHAMLLCEEQEYSQSLKNIEKFEKLYLDHQDDSFLNISQITPSQKRKLSHSQEKSAATAITRQVPTIKLRKQIEYYRILCLVHLKENELAIQLINRYMEQYSKRSDGYQLSAFSAHNSPHQSKAIQVTSSKIRCSKRTNPLEMDIIQKQKIISLLVECYSRIKLHKDAQQVLCRFITEIQDNSMGSDHQKNMNILQGVYYRLIGLNQHDNLLRSIFWAEKWRKKLENFEFQEVKPDTYGRIYSYLFKLYYQIGDYDSAIMSYTEINDKFKKTWFQEFIISQIYTFFGQRESAGMALERSFELLQSEPELARKNYATIKLQIAFLKTQIYEINENTKQRIRKMQKNIKENINKEWIGDVLTSYEDFLLGIGEGNRYHKFYEALQSKVQKPRQSKDKGKEKNEAQRPFIKTGEFVKIDYDEISENISLK